MKLHSISKSKNLQSYCLHMESSKTGSIFLYIYYDSSCFYLDDEISSFYILEKVKMTLIENRERILNETTIKLDNILYQY